MKGNPIGILGAGLSGLTLALTLIHAGFRCTLIEARSEEYVRNTSDDTRTTAIALTTKILFERIGIWDRLAKHAVNIENMYVTTATSAAIRFDPTTFGDQPMGYIIENRDLREALLERIDQAMENGRVDFLFSRQAADIGLNPHSTTVTFVDESKASFSLLIACDGQKSKARTLLRQPAFERDYNQLGLVADVTLERPHNNTAFQVFADNGPIALLPLKTSDKGEDRASLIWSTDKEHGQTLVALSNDQLLYLLNANLPDAFPTVAGIRPLKCFPLRAHYLSSFVKQNLALLGEAAHGVHPLAGQGFNLTARDIGTLTECLQHNLDLGLPVGDTTGLNVYQSRRSGDTAMMFTVTDVLANGMNGTVKIPTLLQHLGFQAVDQLEPLKRRLTKHAMGLTDDLPALMVP